MRFLTAVTDSLRTQMMLVWTDLKPRYKHFDLLQKHSCSLHGNLIPYHLKITWKRSLLKQDLLLVFTGYVIKTENRNRSINKVKNLNICYIITQVILAFWLVLAYDLLEDRRTIDVIVTKFFPPCFKMAESFENLDNILRDWAKDNGQIKACRGIEQFRKAGRGKIKPFLSKK